MRSRLLCLTLALPGCVTNAMWESLDDNKAQKTAAVFLTPVTVAVDVGFFVGVAWVIATMPCFHDEWATPDERKSHCVDSPLRLDDWPPPRYGQAW